MSHILARKISIIWRKKIFVINVVNLLQIQKHNIHDFILLTKRK